MAKAWGGRFSSNESKLMEDFNQSILFDKRLYNDDIDGSIAYSKALKKAKILTLDEQKNIENALNEIRKEFKNGTFKIEISDEDIHMAIEKRLREIVGDSGAKIHTGRSRNDQVATDIRLYLKREINEIKKILKRLLSTIKDVANENLDTYLPGYTHLQQAQIVSYAHYIMLLFWQINRDFNRVQDVEKRVDILPLGSGAIAGNTFNLDRDYLKDLLGFADISENSIDAIADRDFISEFIFVSSSIITHLSRFAEDSIIYSSSEFGFYTFDDMYSTGSSMMPQKKNPDSMELVRGKSGRIYGNLMRILTIQKGIPYSYNKDLQEDKEALFDTIDNLKILVEVVTNVIGTLKINKEKMLESINDFIYATDLADFLVGKGIPFRDAHHIIGSIIGYCEKNGKSLKTLTLDEYQGFSEYFNENVFDMFTPEASTSLRNMKGGTAKESVLWQLEKAEKLLADM